MDWQAAAKILALAVSSIDQIVQIVTAAGDGNHEGSKAQQAAEALLAIGAIVDTVKSGDLENLDVDKVHDELELLLTALGTNDDAADAALDEKFADPQDS